MLCPKSCTILDGTTVDGLASKPYPGERGETGVESTSGGLCSAPVPFYNNLTIVLIKQNIHSLI